MTSTLRERLEVIMDKNTVALTKDRSSGGDVVNLDIVVLNRFEAVNQIMDLIHKIQMKEKLK